MSFIKSIGWTLIAIIIICVSGKVFAGVREILIAKYFGVGRITDSFVIATSIPSRLGLMVGMISYTALIPVFTKYSNLDREDAKRFFNTCFVILASVLSLMTLLVLFNSNSFVRLLAPGLDPASKIMSARLLQIMASALAMLGISSLLRAVNSINQHYIISSVYDPSANFIHLVMIIILVPFIGIYGLAVGLLIGAIGQLLIQGFGFLKGSSSLKVAPPGGFRVDFSHPGIKEFFLSLLPLVAAVAIVETNYFVMRRIASRLPAGAISALNFGLTITYFPIGILDLIIITMIFPFIAGLVNQNRLNEVGRLVSDIAKVIVFTFLPLSVFIIIFRKPIIEIIFQRGAFDAAATQKTSIALGLFSVGLCAWGLDYLLFRIYYLIKEMKTYMKVLSIRVALNILLNIILVKYIMHGGIALAFSIALVIYLLLSVFFLKKRLASFNIGGICAFSLKVAILCVITLLGVYFVYYAIEQGGIILGKIFYVGMAGIIGLAAYLLCAKLIMAKELDIFKTLFKLKTVKLSPFVTGE